MLRIVRSGRSWYCRKYTKLLLPRLCKQLDAPDLIEVWIAQKNQDIDEWVSKHMTPTSIVGFDIEWKPSFHKNRQNRTALVIHGHI